VARVLPSEVLYAYSAALPLALARACEDGTVARGEKLALMTAGGGASWGVSVIAV
jgi:3-oxoacyl-[acyl-carrier-protein] synthase III